jgi:alkaline phosphatase D
MSSLDRRRFLAAAAAAGATLVWAGGSRAAPRGRTERRDLFPEGVASGDPDAHSVLLWTRRPFGDGRTTARLTVEVAADPKFHRLVASSRAPVLAESDWTCRALAAGLTPSQTYWYRFVDEDGNASRVGRTRTAPEPGDQRPVRFAFVSCQNVNQGAQNAFRRMIWEDQRASEADQLGFVLHLGDFIYEVVWYPDDRPQGMFDRRLRDIVRYPTGEKIKDFHIPTTVDDYRAVYRAYLHDPDIQDARAHFPFVAMWDNHEYSWLGFQGLQVFQGKTRPAQTRKVAANQAWFEYQAARVAKPSGPALDRFGPPKVHDAPVTDFDPDGLGLEPNNLTAIRSLTGYRALRWGANVEILITDQHSYRSEDLAGRPEVQLPGGTFLDLYPEEAMAILDAGRTYAGGNPPSTIRLAGLELPNLARDAAKQTLMGATQKAWFKARLAESPATWKIWGDTVATLDMRADPLNLPPGLTKPWPGAGYACFPGGDHSTAYAERAELYDFVRDHRVSGFATVAGDRHAFWAGYAAKALPPAAFEPVGIAFVTGSISAPTMMEGDEYVIPKTHPLRALYLADRPGRAKPEAVLNLTLRHGVKTALEYTRTGDLKAALALSNPQLAPHARFVDMAGHGYATVRASPDRLETDFICIPRPLERTPDADGGPLRYRVRHTASMWPPGETPRLTQQILEGDPGLSTA